VPTGTAQDPRRALRAAGGEVVWRACGRRQESPGARSAPPRKSTGAHAPERRVVRPAVARPAVARQAVARPAAVPVVARPAVAGLVVRPVVEQAVPR
jgi:hypothetical protein